MEERAEVSENHAEDEMSTSMRRLLIESSRMPSDEGFRRDHLMRSSSTSPIEGPGESFVVTSPDG